MSSHNSASCAAEPTDTGSEVEPTDTGSEVEPTDAGSEIERATWSGATDALRRSLVPILFATAGTQLATQPCLSWNVRHLISTADNELRFSSFTQELDGATKAEFVLARGREAEFSASRQVVSRNLSMQEFWGASDDKTLHYHSGLLSEWGEALSRDADDLLELFSLYDAPSDVSEERWPASTGPLVWTGMKGVVATPHYDKSLNLVLQCFGTKRWTLWSPESLGSLRLHPATHPSRRQARDPFSSRADRFPPPAMQIDVRPGELLFVPPFWTHAVESTTHALSLSVISPSWAEAVGARFSWGGLPFGRVAKAPPLSRAMALARYLRRLVPAVLGGEAAPAFLAAVHASRHATDKASVEASEVDGGGGAEWREVARLACASLLANDGEEETERGAQPRAEEIAKAVAGVVRSVVDWRDAEDGDGTQNGARRLEAGSLRELLSSHAEELAAWAVGGARHGMLLQAFGRCAN